jgi:predicted HAD superfamily hydrolase
MTKIASFDVFDTVLTRAFGSPQSCAILLGNKVKDLSLLQYTPEAFARARIDAQVRAVRNAGGIDSKLNLHQIYAELGNALGLTQTQCDELMKLELELEAELIRPVPQARELVQSARDRNQRIIFVSDMYLGTEFIQKQLAHHGLYLDGDRCYVSCDYSKSKASGELFREILRCENTAPNLVSHCGDDLWSDVQSAKDVGLKVTPFLNAKLNRYEEILDSYTWATEGLSSAMAGASRLARLTIPASSLKEEAQRDVAAGVVAPLLVGFTLWVLRRAQKLGLKRLYFVSRDGQILLEIARRLIKKLDFDCELRYFYGSRCAWLLPSITSVDEEHLNGIFWSSASVDSPLSVHTILSRLDINPEQIKSSLVSIGITEKDWLRNITIDERKKLNQLLIQNENIQEIILRKADQKRKVMVKYLKQEGMLDMTEFGFIDVGAAGNLHYMLSSIMSVSTGKLPVSLFPYLGQQALKNQFIRPETYFFDIENNLGFCDNYRFLFALMEIACVADHGSVVDYQEVDEQIKPVIKNEYNQQVINWGYHIVRKTICSFTDNLLLDFSLVNPQADVRAATIEAIETFCSNPSFAEANAWGSFPVELGLEDEYFVPYLAKSYAWKDMIQPFLPEYKATWRQIYWWHEGALVLTPPLLRTALKISINFGQYIAFLNLVKYSNNNG